MGYLLKEVLKTLCGVNQWSYAVFWKIGCQNPKLLIWEECYYGPASFSTLPGISGICNREFAFQDYSNNASSVTAETRNLRPDISAGDNVHFLVNKMTMDSYVKIVGEGLVGRAAFTGNHQWILSDNDYREAHPPEIVKELGQQFSAGMQTVAVIPVLPNGVVQFGSSLTIPENNGFVNDVVSLVHPLGYIAKDPDPICPVYSTPGDLSSSFVSDSFNYVGCSSSAMGGIKISEQKTESDNGSQLHFTSKNLSEMGTSLSDSFDHLTTNSLFAYCSGVEDNRVNDMPAKTEFEQAKIAQFMPGFVEADINQKIEGQINLVNNTNHRDAWFQPQSGEDLFDILGDEFDNKLFRNCSNIRLSNVSPKNNSPSRKNLVSSSEIISSTQEKSDSGIFSFNNTDDHLLDAVVSKVPYGRYGVSDHVKGELLGIPQYMANAGALRNRPSEEESGTFSQGSSIYDSWVETGSNTKQNNSSATACSSKLHDETNKTKRKRLKPGENPRPRPKDRQMIQDRVKELREIVPNGAKCSIDALLERTIKHMLFLQSVTKHADKLKQTVESKIISKDGGMLMKENNGGATWAYEVGSQSMVCPIIVEDLNQPRQMLVEMLCEERGIFLEIADIIRGLGLTILKGLMETRNDKIWAHFTVEANRNMTRMEVFISLVHLLEQNAKNGVQQPNNVSNVNTMVGLC